MGLDLGWRLVDCGDKTLKMGTKEEGGKTMRERETERNYTQSFFNPNSTKCFSQGLSTTEV